MFDMFDCDNADLFESVLKVSIINYLKLKHFLPPHPPPPPPPHES